MDMRLHHATWYLAALAAAGMPTLAGAQGFGLNEIGSCAVGRASTNTAAPCRDASMIFWNPAAISGTSGHSLLVGAAMISVNGDFTQDTTGKVFEGNIAPEFPPHLFWSYQNPASRLGYGLGFYVPYGLTSQWHDDFPGRFSAIKASLQSPYIQPTISYRISPNWSIGGGPIAAHSALELQQALDLSSVNLPGSTTTFGQLGIPRGTEFGRLAAEGSDWGFGYALAIQGKLSPTWQLGVRYLSEVDFEYEGDANFTQTQTGLVFAADVPNPANPTGPPAIPAGTSVDALLAPQFTAPGVLVKQGIATNISHPAQVQAGVAYSGFPNTSVSVEYEWLGWKSFADLPVNFVGPAESRSRTLIEDYNNSSVIRLGVDHLLARPGFGNGWSLRAGASAATSAAPRESVTPLLPEQDRYTLGLGAGIPVASRFALDVSYLNVGVWGSRGRIVERESRDQTAEQLNTGFYRLNAHVLSLSLKANF
jgi:long-chain fatty acid transport protein